MNKLREIKPVEAMALWPEAEKHLRMSVETARQDEDLLTLKARVLAGLNTLWLITDDKGEPIAWATTMLYTSNGITVTAKIEIATTNDMQEFISNLDEFEVWAYKHGANYIEITGRLGWTKVLKPLGFEHNYTSLTKRVTQEIH